MVRFRELKHLAWSIFAVFTVAFALGGCEGDDGTDGAPGATGAPGADGVSCWDLNANGVGDLPDEDINGDGVVDAQDCSADADQIAASIEEAEVESCATCHGGAGDGHQAIYDQYKDASRLTLAITDLLVAQIDVDVWTLTMDFSITKDGEPYIDPIGNPPSLDSTSFYVVEYDSASGEFYNSAGGFAFSLSASNAASNGDGTYTLTQDVSADPTAFTGGAIVGRIADGLLDIEDNQASKRVRMYEDLAGASWPLGDIGSYVSAANADGCASCHGAPYRKHGNSPAVVAGVPDFTYCKGCHNNTASGGHPEWQHMVDNPLAWATGTPLTAEEEALYAYERTLFNDVHMSHAMEFPYPMSAANCNTCHEGKLDTVLDNSNFALETCKSCHVMRGIDSWPGEIYNQPHRPPAFAYLWQRDADLTFHETLDPGTDCTECHGAGIAPEFNAYHSGYDEHIYDDLGNRYADAYTVSIDNITYDAVNYTLTVEFSSNDVGIIPELLVSFYGWDTKDYIIPSHFRDATDLCPSRWGDGCRYEYVPESSGGDPHPFFTEDEASTPGSWIVTADFTAFVAELTDDIPTMIDNLDITKVEVAVTPEFTLDTEELNLNAVSQTFDLGAMAMVGDYFKGANAIVDVEKCNACHDQLAVTFHSGSGRGGDITTCRNCHVTVNPGSHLEMQSRSLDSYVHAVHSFEDFDTDDIFEVFDPVFAKRYDQHVGHTFPNFTILSCEGCHNPGTYNVPDQSKSMPGVLSRSWSLNTWYEIVGDAAEENTAGRNIGTVPEFVTGPASRACGSCHRADFIFLDDAGELASFNAHTDAFGTLVENDSDDFVLFGIIDKIMTWFE